MFNRTATAFFKATVLAGAIAISQTALAGRVILNHDEWTLTDHGFSVATPSTTNFASNLASFMNGNGGGCSLLVYSNNFGLTGSSLNSALTGAGCSVTYSTGAFDLATLSAFDGVLLSGTQFSYDAAALTSYVNNGGSAYIAAGTGATVAEEGTAWDSFANAFGLDFGPSYNGIIGNLTITSSDPLLAGVSQLFFNNGNTVGLFGSNPDARIIAVENGTGSAGLIGVYDHDSRRVTPAVAVPEPATLALLGVGLAGLGFARRRSH